MKPSDGFDMQDYLLSCGTLPMNSNDAIITNLLIDLKYGIEMQDGHAVSKGLADLKSGMDRYPVGEFVTLGLKNLVGDTPGDRHVLSSQDNVAEIDGLIRKLMF